MGTNKLLDEGLGSSPSPVQDQGLCTGLLTSETLFESSCLHAITTQDQELRNSLSPGWHREGRRGTPRILSLLLLLPG